MFFIPPFYSFVYYDNYSYYRHSSHSIRRGVFSNLVSNLRYLSFKLLNDLFLRVFFSLKLRVFRVDLRLQLLNFRFLVPFLFDKLFDFFLSLHSTNSLFIFVQELLMLCMIFLYRFYYSLFLVFYSLNLRYNSHYLILPSLLFLSLQPEWTLSFISLPSLTCPA